MVLEFSPLQDLKSLLKLIKELRRIQPDVIPSFFKAGVLGRIPANAVSSLALGSNGGVASSGGVSSNRLEGSALDKPTSAE
jgi:hypothetical protein